MTHIVAKGQVLEYTTSCSSVTHVHDNLEPLIDGNAVENKYLQNYQYSSVVFSLV